MMDCLTEIVGVVQTDTECITGGLSSETIAKLKASKSDRYLDNLVGGIHLKALRYIDAAQTMADLSLAARDEAIKNMEADLVMGVSMKYNEERPTYMGTIGKPSYTGTLPGGKRYQGIRIRPVNESDAAITLTRIMGIFTQGGTIPIVIYRVPKDTVQGEVIATYNLTATANQFAEYNLPTPLVLPFVTDNYMTEVEYWFLYDTLVTGVPFQPKDTIMGCGSCNSIAADILADYADVYGVTVDDPLNLNDRTVDQYSHGLILSVDIRCKTDQLFCREYENRNPISVAMSYAVWYKAGAILIREVLKSPDINRYTMMDQKVLDTNALYFEKMYAQRLGYIVEAVNVKSSNCYICKQVANQPITGGILL